MRLAIPFFVDDDGDVELCIIDIVEYLRIQGSSLASGC